MIARFERGIYLGNVDVAIPIWMVLLVSLRVHFDSINMLAIQQSTLAKPYQYHKHLIHNNLQCAKNMDYVKYFIGKLF